MNKPLVSIIMATYNCQDYIRKSVESIINQTYDNWEFIICDDGSTDQTYLILQEYQEKNSEKIKLIKNEVNSKLPFSLNRCLEYATGEFVARMDGDDISEPTRIETQVKFLLEHPEYDLVGTGMKIFDGYKIIGSHISKNTSPNKERLIYGPCFSHATIMTYKKVYDALNGYSLDPKIERCEDYDLWFRFFEKGFKGYNLQKTLYIVTEDAECIKRKKIKYRFNEAYTMWKGFKLIGIRKTKYIYIIKPLVAIVIPNKILRKYHNKRDVDV